MQNKQLFGSLAVLLSLSCSTGLVVGEDPPGTGGRTSGDGDGSSASKLPCDILEADGHSCVAAHSTVRLLRRAYDGTLYQVCKDSTTRPAQCQGDSLDILDIGATASGSADAAAQAEFCGSDVLDCAITIIYDQSGEGHHLEPAPPGSANPTPSNPVLAARLPTTVNGRDAYGVLIRPGSGYRAGCTACKQEPSSEMPRPSTWSPAMKNSSTDAVSTTATVPSHPTTTAMVLRRQSTLASASFGDQGQGRDHGSWRTWKMGYSPAGKTGRITTSAPIHLSNATS